MSELSQDTSNLSGPPSHARKSPRSRVHLKRRSGWCNWNELATPDQASANKFYETLFGWTYPDKMAMGEAGDYVFIAVGENRIGATMKQGDKQPKGWRFYFRVPDIDAAVEKVKAGGGQVHAGPMDVPGGDRVIVASDPQGVPFGIAAPGKAG